MAADRPVRALVAEDEALMRTRLVDALRDLWPELEIVAIVADGDEALAAFERMRPDVAFLDIRMPGASGLDVAAEICDRCEVVFITAHDEHALTAFERGAIDYVLKPVERERLATTVERVKRRLARHATAGGEDPEPAHALLRELLAGIVRGQDGVRSDAQTRLKWLRVSVGNQVRLVAVSDVVYFQSDTKYTRVVLQDSEALVRLSLKELLDGLDPEQFWQIHRSIVVNASAIQSALREGPEKITVALKGRTERLPVSRSFFHLFKQH